MSYRILIVDDEPEMRRMLAALLRGTLDLDRLLELTAQALPQRHRRMRLLLPYEKGALLHALRQEGKVLSQEYLPEGVLVEALVDCRLAEQAAPYQAPPAAQPK